MARTVRYSVLNTLSNDSPLSGPLTVEQHNELMLELANLARLPNSPVVSGRVAQLAARIGNKAFMEVMVD